MRPSVVVLWKRLPTRNQSKTTQRCTRCCGHKSGVPFVVELPRIWRGRSFGNTCLIAVEQVDDTVLGKQFQRSEALYFVSVFFRIRRKARRLAEAFVSTAVFLRKRLSVLSENSFLRAACASMRANFSCCR